jgi:hypothetical protein
VGKGKHVLFSKGKDGLPAGYVAAEFPFEDHKEITPHLLHLRKPMPPVPYFRKELIDAVHGNGPVGYHPQSVPEQMVIVLHV